MPTLVAESKTIQRDLLTAEDFLDWLVPSRVVEGFRLRRAWLDPEALPVIGDCLAEMA